MTLCGFVWDVVSHTEDLTATFYPIEAEEDFKHVFPELPREEFHFIGFQHRIAKIWDIAKPKSPHDGDRAVRSRLCRTLFTHP
jgi:hypothetical protein